MNLWKQKLAAYLHDPPANTVELADHKSGVCGRWKADQHNE